MKGKWDLFLNVEENKLKGRGFLGHDLKKKMDEVIKREEDKF